MVTCVQGHHHLCEQVGAQQMWEVTNEHNQTLFSISCKSPILEGKRLKGPSY